MENSYKKISGEEWKIQLKISKEQKKELHINVPFFLMSDIWLLRCKLLRWLSLL